jgi:hypothetical protein
LCISINTTVGIAAGFETQQKTKEKKRSMMLAQTTSKKYRQREKKLRKRDICVGDNIKVAGKIGEHNYVSVPSSA